MIYLQSIKEFQSEEHLQILEEETVLNIKENDKSLYICDPFRGVGFSHLKKVCHPAAYFELCSFLFRSTHVHTYILHVLSCTGCSSMNFILYIGKKVASKA